MAGKRKREGRIGIDRREERGDEREGGRGKQGCLESFWDLGHIKNLAAPCNTFVVPLTMGAQGKLPLLPPSLGSPGREGQSGEGRKETGVLTW